MKKHVTHILLLVVGSPSLRITPSEELQFLHCSSGRTESPSDMAEHGEFRETSEKIRDCENKSVPSNHDVLSQNQCEQQIRESCVTKGEGKPERFLLHLKPLQGALEAFCRRSLYDVSQVEDVLQEAVTRAFRDFGLFSEGTNFRAWIFRYLNLVLLEANRDRAGRDQQSIDVEPTVETEWQFSPDETLLRVLLDSPEIVLEQCGDQLNQAVRTLKPADRSVLLLKSIGEFRYREIAEIIGVPLGTVMSSLARAREQVRHELTKRVNEHGERPSQTIDHNPKCDP
jgi:RNA polymerase sigma-70 factor, ECF subfamily